MAAGQAAQEQSGKGPVVWWLRNDLRLEDNPVARLAASEALMDGRACAPIFFFDPRFFDHSPYGRVTDPEFKKSIATRKPITFGNRKCSALRARFILQCVRSMAARLKEKGSRLHCCHGKPEDVLASLPASSLVVCQAEPVSVECTDIEKNVEAALALNSSELRCDWGAMSLYHRADLPFSLEEPEKFPSSFTELGETLGWDDIWSVPGRSATATQVRPPATSPAVMPSAPGKLELQGLMAEEVLADDHRALRQLGYSEEEISAAVAQAIPEGGEPHARALMEEWLGKQGKEGKEQSAVYWDLPTAPVRGSHDALQWANLARPDGWTRMSHYLAVGCISAREIFARSAACPNFTGVAHRLMWREFHRLNAIRFGRRLFWLQGPGWIERPWSWDTAQAEAWKLGKTGVPYVDACMRELRQTGWLAYKGRKTAGFFLAFGLGIDWRLGAYHYEDVLLDYDCAMNYGNWVTVANVDKASRGSWGPGTTLPELMKAYREDIEWKLSAEMANDPSGEYIRRWVPELKGVASAYIHRPWAMPEEEAARCGVKVGEDYPASLMGPLFVCTDEEQWAQRRRAEAKKRGREEAEGEGQASKRSRAAEEEEDLDQDLQLWHETALSVRELQGRLASLEAKVEQQAAEISSLRQAKQA